MSQSSPFQFSMILESLPFLWTGVVMTLVVSVSGLLFGMVIGLVIALIRLLPGKASGAITLLLVNFLQSTPVLVLLLWIYFALPLMLGITILPVPAGIAVLAIYSGAYLSEAFRAGILGIKKGQWEAARALGMSNLSVLKRIILPQALVQVLPPVASIWISTIKESALISAISVEDLMYRATSLAAYSLRPVESLTAAAAIYFVVLYPFILLTGVFYRRMQRVRKNGVV